MPSLANTLRRCHSTVRARQEQLGADLRVGQAVPRQPGDVGLLRGERGRRLDAALAHLLAGGDQLPAGALGERRHADRGEHVVGGAQLRARVRAAALPAQPLAVEQVRAGQLRAQPGPAEPVDRLAVQVARRLRRRSAAPGSAPRCPAPKSVPPGLRRLRQPLERVGGELGVPAARGRLDQLGQRPHGDVQGRRCPRWPAGPPTAPPRSGRGRCAGPRPPSARRPPRSPGLRPRPRSMVASISAEASASLPAGPRASSR